MGLGAGTAMAATAPYWNTTGSYVISMVYNSMPYAHDMVLTQDGSGNLTGHGGSPAGSNVYTWVIDSGSVSGNTINFNAHYTATADAVTPLTTLTVTGTIAPNGSMSGNWSDNYQGGARSGTWTSTTGNAVALGSLAAQDFGVMNVSGVKGYTAGFGLTDATLADIQSVVVKLYSGSTLLQTNTGTSQIETLPGVQFSSPFDVFGTFNYATDGYWTNVREAEYGQTLIPTKVIATVTLDNGKVLTAENDNLTGDPATIQPVSANVTTNPATLVTSSDAVLNGTNGATAALGHSFWVSLAPFVTTSSSIPSGVYSTPDMGAIGAGASFNATLSSITTSGVPGNLPAITPNTTYYFAAWSNVGGTWYPGAVLSFTTAATTTTEVANVTTNPATGVDNTDATLNGTNGSVAADNTSFWWGTTSAGPFTSMADPTSEFPAGWTHDGGLGSALVGGTFNEPLTGLTPNTTYYFVAWSHVGGIWYPGLVLSFMTTTPAPTTGTISGMKYNDLNRNGKLDPNEPGLQGWVIRLMSGSKLIATTTTDANGNYTFSNIVPGTYQVRETHQKGWKRQSKNPKSIVISAGSVVTDVNFGNAVIRRGERQDTSADDNRNDQSGKYYANGGKSDYDKDQNNSNYQQFNNHGQ